VLFCLLIEVKQLAEQQIFTYADLALARPLEAFVGSLPVAGCEIF
jgi:hypothetical protein